MYEVFSEKKQLITFACLLVVLLWAILSGWYIWQRAASEKEPPAFDGFSYAHKAKNIWDAVNSGKWFNPLNIEPSSRPPGTVVMSYPLGFSEDFKGFLFRSLYIPLILILASTLITGVIHSSTNSQKIIMLAVVLAAISMPALVQLQPSDEIPATGYWGLVDNFMAGVAALAATMIIIASRRPGNSWSIAAALFSAFTVLIKPAGLALMFALAGSWLVLTTAYLGNLRDIFGSIRKRLAYFSAIYLIIVLLIFNSRYFSSENLQYGKVVLAILKNEYSPGTNLTNLFEYLKRSLGLPLLLIMLLGLLASLRNGWRSYAVASLLVLAAGAWFWLIKADISQVRYFLPFALAGAIFVIPPLLDLVRPLPVPIAILAASILSIPTALTGYLMLQAQPDIGLQRTVGVNLSSNRYDPEVEQARNWIDRLENNGKSHVIYLCGVSSPLRALASVIYYSTYIKRYHPVDALVRLPVDWQRTSAYRIDDLIESEYIAFEPYGGDILNPPGKKITTFDEEALMIRAWLTGLGENEGISIQSQTRVRLIKVVDVARFEKAAAKVVASYQWRSAFLDGYNQRWLNSDELNAQLGNNLISEIIDLKDERGTTVAQVVGITQGRNGENAFFDVWIRPIDSLPKHDEAPWYVFAHLIDNHDESFTSGQTLYSEIIWPDKIRQYRILLSPKGHSYTSAAVGVYSPGERHNFLLSNSGDWQGRRIRIDLDRSTIH